MPQLGSRSWSPWTLSSVGLGFVVIGYHLLRASTDQTLEGVDVPNHFLFTLHFHYALQALLADPSFTWAEKLYEFARVLTRPPTFGTYYWPNGYNLVAALFYAVFGVSIAMAKMAMAVFMALLLGAVTALGRRYSGPRTGFFAALLTASIPIVLQSSWQPQLDLPNAAMVTLALYCLMRTRHFRNTSASALFGLVCGLGLLVKGQLAIFLSFAVAAILVEVLLGAAPSEPGEPTGRIGPILRLALATALAAALAYPWWGVQAFEAMRGFLSHITDRNVSHLDPATGTGWQYRQEHPWLAATYYLRILPVLLGVPGLLVFLFGLGSFVRRRGPYFVVFSATLAGPFLLYSLFIHFQHPRFLLPLVPILAVLTARALEGFGARLGPLLRLSIIVYCGLHGVVAAVFPLPPLRLITPHPPWFSCFFGWSMYAVPNRAESEDPRCDEVSKVLLAHVNSETDTRPVVLFLVDVSDYYDELGRLQAAMGARVLVFNALLMAPDTLFVDPDARTLLLVDRRLEKRASFTPDLLEDLEHGTLTLGALLLQYDAATREKVLLFLGDRSSDPVKLLDRVRDRTCFNNTNNSMLLEVFPVQE